MVVDRASFKKARLIRDAEFLYNEQWRFNLNFGSDKRAISMPVIIAVELMLKRGSSQHHVTCITSISSIFFPPAVPRSSARKLYAHVAEGASVYLCEHIYQTRNTACKTPPSHAHLRRMSLLYSYSRVGPVHGWLPEDGTATPEWHTRMDNEGAEEARVDDGKTGKGWRGKKRW
jgi:hypothetical protein